jgi:transcriptional regulator with XRE-family HTH domain
MQEHDIRTRFGARVRQLRNGRGWSQEELADRAGLHRTYVGSIERGEQNLSLVNIEKLAATLGVSLAELFAPFTDQPVTPP